MNLGDTKYKSSASFGIRSQRKIEKDKRILFKNRKFNIILSFAVFLFTTSLVVLLVFEMLNSTRPVKPRKAKRFANMEMAELPTNETRLNVQNKETKNIELVPESDEKVANRRMSQHPNHRYTDMGPDNKIYEKMREGIYTENAWSPKSFKIPLNGPLNNVRDIILRDKMNQKDRQRLNSKNTRSPMRLKGVYLQEDNGNDDDDEVQEENVDDDDDDYYYYYVKEINKLIQNNTNEGSNWNTKISHYPRHMNHGSPFQRPYQEAKIAQRFQKINSKIKKEWAKPRTTKKKKKSITVLLDIYPMNEYQEEDIPEEKFVYRERPKKEMIYIPVKHKEGLLEPVTGSAIFPGKSFYSDRKQKMLMKLNLYPKNRKFGGRQHKTTESHIGEVIYPRNNEKVQRRTLNLFSKKKKKKKKPTECTLVGIHPYKKSVTAKWKGENGEWIHSKGLAIKHYKDKDWKDTEGGGGGGVLKKVILPEDI